MLSAKTGLLADHTLVKVELLAFTLNDLPQQGVFIVRNICKICIQYSPCLSTL